jgi:heat shock protein HslJ
MRSSDATVLCAFALILSLPAGAAETPLVCFGNEPSWGVDLTAPGQARLSRLGEKPTVYEGRLVRHEPLRESVFRGSAAGRDLVVLLREAACRDGMSDDPHPVTARVSLPDGTLLAGCCRVAAATTAPAAPMISLEDASWRLTALTGQDARALAGLPRPVILRFERGRVSGFVGCNRLMGLCTVEGERLILGPLAGTMMACPSPAMEIEHALKVALNGTARYAIAGDELRVTAESGAVLTFAAEPPPRLEGAAWEVTGYNNGRQAVVSPQAAGRITLSFAGTVVSGGTGCNTFRAPYSTDGGRIQVGPAATTRMACEARLLAQESEFLAALVSAASWSVERGALDLYRADGERVIRAIVAP